MTTELNFLALPGWIGLQLKGRVDAFNDKRLMDSMESVLLQSPTGSSLALDLSQAEFLSMQMMRFLADLRHELIRRQGNLVLVQPSHPVRRQIEIFFGLKVFPVYQSFQELQLGQHFLPRAEYLDLDQSALPHLG